MDAREDPKIPIRRSRGLVCDSSTAPSERGQTTSAATTPRQRARRRRPRRHLRAKDPEKQAPDTPSPAGGKTRRFRQATTAPQTGNGGSSPASNRHSKPPTSKVLTENIAYIDLEGEPEDESLVDCFMTKDGALPRRKHEAEAVNFAYPRDRLKELQSNNPNIPTKNVCLVDDRTNDGTTSTSLGDHAPLNRQKFYHKLTQPRFHGQKDPPPEESSSPGSSSETYSTDPDDYCHGFPSVSLSFHLPCFVWRSAQHHKAPCDTRLNRDGGPLRRVINIDFLGGPKNPQSILDEIEYLCESQTSVLIKTIDHYRWTGICLVDTYSQDGDQRECVDKYHETMSEPDGIQSDPFLEGESEASRPLLDARQYFLTVLDCRAKVFGEEWQISADKLERRISKYIEACSLISATPEVGFKQYLSWIDRTKKQLRELVDCLHATIKRWKCFQRRGHFRAAKEAQYMASIDETFVSAGHCMNQLRSLCTRCDEHAKSIKLRMSDEGNSSGKLHAELTKCSQTMTYIMIYFFYPPTLAAGMLSMQEKAIPGVFGPGKLSFLTLTGFLTALVVIIVRAMHKWDKILLLVQQLSSKERIKRALGSPVGSDHQGEDIELGVG
ncbi:hypothetical protein ACJZ2D_001392 [Fusarium nematophilum]